MKQIHLVSNFHWNDWMQPSRSSCFCYERKQKLFRRSRKCCVIVGCFHVWGNLWVGTAAIFGLLWFLMQVYNVTCKFSYLGRNFLGCHKSLAIWGFPFQLDVHGRNSVCFLRVLQLLMETICQFFCRSTSHPVKSLLAQGTFVTKVECVRAHKKARGVKIYSSNGIIISNRCEISIAGDPYSRQKGLLLS